MKTYLQAYSAFVKRFNSSKQVRSTVLTESEDRFREDASKRIRSEVGALLVRAKSEWPLAEVEQNCKAWGRALTLFQREFPLSPGECDRLIEFSAHLASGAKINREALEKLMEQRESDEREKRTAAQYAKTLERDEALRAIERGRKLEERRNAERTLEGQFASYAREIMSHENLPRTPEAEQSATELTEIMLATARAQAEAAHGAISATADGLIEKVVRRFAEGYVARGLSPDERWCRVVACCLVESVLGRGKVSPFVAAEEAPAVPS